MQGLALRLTSVGHGKMKQMPTAHTRLQSSLFMTSLAGPVFVLLSLLLGCDSFPRVPLTEGFHKALPNRNTTAVVWGQHPSVTASAIPWLQRRGLNIVERARLQQVFMEQEIRLTHTPDDEPQVLRVGRLLGAKWIIFIDASVTKKMHYAAWVWNYHGEVYDPRVAVRVVNLENGEVILSGSARFSRATPNLEDSLSDLTCQALATAWGFRSPGQHEITSQAMCSIGESDSLEKR